MGLRSCLVGIALGLTTSIAVVVILARRWAECDIGINSAANSFGLVLFVAPLVAAIAALTSGLGFRVIARWSAAAAYVGAIVLSALVGAAAVWIERDAASDYPTPLCAASQTTSA